MGLERPGAGSVSVRGAAPDHPAARPGRGRGTSSSQVKLVLGATILNCPSLANHANADMVADMHGMHGGLGPARCGGG
jgi:hypothetical protein